jgi:hypothetical protein
MKNSVVPWLRFLRLAGCDGFSSLRISTFFRFSRVAMKLLWVATKSCFFTEARMRSISLRMWTWLRWFSARIAWISRVYSSAGRHTILMPRWSAPLLLLRPSRSWRPGKPSK